MESSHRLPPRQQVTQKFPVVGEREPDAAALNLETWRLTVSGEVEQPQSWTYDDLQRLPQVDVIHDIHCVTRWSRLGCHWHGVAFDTIAAQVRPTPEARFVQFIFTLIASTTPLSAVSSARDGGVLLAWEMDDATLERGPMFATARRGPTRYFLKVKWVHGSGFSPWDMVGYWERGGYHNNGDFWQEERYVSGNLNAIQIERLRRNGNFHAYRDQILLSLDLSGADFTGLDMRRVQLKHCTLAGCQLQNADLRAANLTNSDLQNANLQGANLQGADLEGTLFMGADLRHCNMRDVHLAAAEFWRPGQPAARVEGLDLRGAMTDDLLEDQDRFLRQQGVL